MSFSAALDYLVDAVEALTPTRDASQGFVYLRGSSFASLDQAVNVPRVFAAELVAPPVDDGEAGAVSRRLRCGLALTLQYPAAEDADYLLRVRAEDAGLLARHLPHIGSGAEAGAAGLLAIPPAGTPRLATVTDRDGRVLAHRVIIPLDLIYTD